MSGTAPGAPPVAAVTLAARLAGATATVAVTLAAWLGAAAGASAQDAPYPIAAWSRTAAVPESDGTLRERGAAIFNNWCDACHRNSDMNAPGTRSLQFKYRGELPAALEERADLTPELVAFYVRNGVAMMPFFRPTEISDEDLQALGAYLSGD